MIHVSDAEFERAVERSLADVPNEFKPLLENVIIEIRDRPDPALMAEHDIPDDLLGLYAGCPWEDKVSEHNPTPMPDRVYVFRDNLCEMCETREELLEEIRITVLHEIGHHFGLDEDRLEELGYD